MDDDVFPIILKDDPEDDPLASLPVFPCLLLLNHKSTGATKL